MGLHENIFRKNVMFTRNLKKHTQTKSGENFQVWPADWTAAACGPRAACWAPRWRGEWCAAALVLRNGRILAALPSAWFTTPAAAARQRGGSAVGPVPMRLQQTELQGGWRGRRSGRVLMDPTVLLPVEMISDLIVHEIFLPLLPSGPESEPATICQQATRRRSPRLQQLVLRHSGWFTVKNKTTKSEMMIWRFFFLFQEMLTNDSSDTEQFFKLSANQRADLNLLLESRKMTKIWFN